MKYLLCFLLILSILLCGCNYEGAFLCTIDGEDMVYISGIAGSQVFQYHNFLPVSFKCYLYKGDIFLLHLQRLSAKERIIVSLYHISTNKRVLKKVIPIKEQNVNNSGIPEYDILWKP